MNKSTKIWRNYLPGLLLAALLLYLLYIQVARQLETAGPEVWKAHASNSFLLLGLLLLPLNLGLEAWKWKLLAGTATTVSSREALSSYLAGLSFSAITPNRIGEYPGRILFLGKKNTPRLISVSVLGMFAQLSAVMLGGIAGLIYYNATFPGRWPMIALVATLILTAVLVYCYLRFERWAPRLERMRWMRRFRTYTSLLRRFTIKEQLVILGLSLLRFLVFTAQYLTLLYWMNVTLPLAGGFFMAQLFFWVMTVVPSVALAELGIRGHVSLALFSPFSNHTIGILAATALVWGINLVLPAVAGSLLWMRKKWLSPERTRDARKEK